MSGERILVVDDDASIRRLVTLALARQGYCVEPAGSGAETMDRLSGGQFDVMLLDLGLPDRDGVGICREVRTWSNIPIIVISVRESEQDKVKALDAGADDYLTKPFGIDELLARIRATLRRATTKAQEPAVRFGPLVVDLARRIVTKNGEMVRLTPTEWDLLRLLTVNAGKVLTHRQLLREARGPGYEEDTPLLRVHLAGLRSKLALQPGTPGYIATESGVGYRLLDE